ncbi:hypothetical protein F4777DRAFT_533463 [Nemania sp. FL0916]|nr:hypothetical protein F4777DRAFT_533463 [Nemania sp. FL0916]
MARLNEPPVSTDSIETLRRRFLRQNRDIARVNSTQSLKIRQLENECARLLSENLQLRSDILRLNKELEGSHARRVADHALEIKEKMEAQLIEWGAMLAGLGHEPVPRSRSPRALKKAKIQRNSASRSRSSEWRRRETMGSIQDLEAAALQEGRLPPIWETKTYPRETLNQDEILALCSENEDSTDSPDLGPPPVSRFVDEDPVKLDLPTLTRLLKPSLGDPDSSGLEETCQDPKPYPKSPAASTKTQDVAPEPKAQHSDKIREATKSIPAPDSSAATASPTSNLKRKMREEDEKENVPISRPPLSTSTTTKIQSEKAAVEKAKPSSRPIKELPSHKRDSSRDGTSNTTQRRPLGAKNSNEPVGSQKKSVKAFNEGKGAKPKMEGKQDNAIANPLKPREDPKPVEILCPKSPEIIRRVDIEPESLSAEPDLVVPESPEASVQREKINDTPPPVDISSKGETTRGGRRARAAVSYAEPNLRDKMRRPNTNKLFDAVAGEGKNVRRTSQCQRDEPPSGPSSVAKSESSHKDTHQQTSHDVGRDIDIMASPLAQKTNRIPVLDELPASVTTERRRKESTATIDHNTDSDTATHKPTAKNANRRLDQIAAREAEVAELFENSDVYEFTDSSPNEISEETIVEAKSKLAKGRRPSRARRLSSVTCEDLQPGSGNTNTTTQAEKAPSKHAAGRKRASMAAIKATKSELENMRGDSPSLDGDSVSTVESEGTGTGTTTREKTVGARRRTTMS